MHAGHLAAARGQPIRQLPARHVQQKHGHWCGPATAHMLLQARLGPAAPSQEQLAWVAENKGGTYRGELQQVLNDHLEVPVYEVRQGGQSPRPGS